MTSIPRLDAPGISARGITVRFGGMLALEGVDVEIPPTPGVTGIIGPNGSGKSTLLGAIIGAVALSDGAVWIDATAREHLTRGELARRVALVAQSADANALQTASDIVMHGRLPHRGAWGRERAEDLEIVEQCLRQVGAGHLARRPLTSLSGGEAQRVMIARALAQQPRYLLLDEPTNHLDVHYQHRIMQLVRNLRVRVVVVLHDLNLANRYCDDVYLLHQGTVVASGAPSAVLQPEVLEPVYEIGVEAVSVAGQRHLVFHPLESGGGTDGKRESE